MATIGELHLEKQREKAIGVLAGHQARWVDNGTDTEETPVWLKCSGCAWAAEPTLDDDKAETAHRVHVVSVLVELRIIH